MNKKRLVVGISGASGAILGINLLEMLKDFLEWETHLVISKGAELTIKDETEYTYVSHELSSRLNKNVVVTCGIHLDNITQEEINITIELLSKLTEQLISSTMFI